MIKGLLKYLFGFAVADGDGPSVQAGTATVGDVTVSGDSGSSITADVVITLGGGAKFKGIGTSVSVASWFTSFPIGLTAYPKTAVTAGATSITITISGIPASGVADGMAITVPATAIDGKTPSPIPVTPNPKARFDIAQTVADETAFAAFAQRVNNGEYALSGKLTGNINVPSAATYIPIARPVMGEDEKLIFNPYTGTLDGNGNTVTIDLTGDASFLSLVAHNNGTIMNLIVAGKVKADIPTPLPSPDFSIDYIAGVVAYNDIYGLIERVISKVTVDAKDNETHCIGGIAGFNDWDQYNDDSPHAGKDPGDQESRGTIRQCRNEGEVLGGFNKIGGIVGENAGDVIECANIGTITVHKDGRGWPGVGGIVGRDGNNNTPTEKGGIENCRNAGDITESDPMGNAENAFGSIAGYSDDLGTIKGCLAVGKFIERRGQKNPIVGMVDEDAPDKSVNNYALDSIFKTSDKTALIGIPKTEEYMKSQEFVDEINAAIGSNVYAKDPDGGFPKLAWEVGLSAPDPKDGQKKN